MIEMIHNSFYESKTNFLLIKRETSDQKREIWTVKKMSFSIYIAKLFNLKVFGKWMYFQIGLFLWEL